jgi:hypothetical protein
MVEGWLTTTRINWFYLLVTRFGSSADLITNAMNLFLIFSLYHNNSIIECTWLKGILGCVIFRKESHEHDKKSKI